MISESGCNDWFSLADEKAILERENEKLHRKLKMMLSILDKEKLKEFSTKTGFWNKKKTSKISSFKNWNVKSVCSICEI